MVFGGKSFYSIDTRQKRQYNIAKARYGKYYLIYIGKRTYQFYF